MWISVYVCECTVLPEREMMFRIWWSAFLAFTSGCYWGYEIAWNAGSFLSPIKPVRAFFAYFFRFHYFVRFVFLAIAKCMQNLCPHLRCKSLYLTKNTATFAPWNMWQFIMWVFFFFGSTFHGDPPPLKISFTGFCHKRLKFIAIPWMWISSMGYGDSRK